MSLSADPEEPGQEQPFVSHLIELRDRLMRGLLAVLLVFLVLFPFANDIYSYVAEPLMAQLPEGTSMIATQVASPFLTPFKLALVSSAFLSMPYLLFQLWSFVVPGLYSHEKQLAIPLLISSILLFYLGMLFAYYLVFPLVFAFLTGTAPEGVAVMTDISHYLDFVLTLFFAFGIAFEIPIATILLVAAGITTPEDLGRKRPYLIVGVFVVGMLLTPPDVISQTLLALPMWLLFELGILSSRLFQRRRQTAAAAREAATSNLTDMAASARTRAGESPAPSGPGGKSGGEETPVDRDISGGNPFDAEHFDPLTEEEIEAELDAIEAAEEDLTEISDQLDPVEEKLRRIKTLRDRGEDADVRRLLYEILETGDDEQQRVARNILDQLDTP